MGQDRAAQPGNALGSPAVADQFAADDPVVFRLGAPADRGKWPGTKAGEQGGVGKDRIHARGKGCGIRRKPMVGTA